MMKTIKNSLIAGLSGIALVFTISACQKGFDPKTYAPVKPLPTFDGYAASNDIDPGNLVAYWNFSGSLADSVTKATGTATGTTFASGISGQGLQGGLNDYAVCTAPAALAGLTSFTVSAWVNTPPPTTGVLDWFTLVNKTQFWGNIEMFFDNGSNNTDAHVRVHISQNGTDFTFAAEPANLFDKWVNLIFSYDASSSTCTLYVNGKPVASGKAGNLAGPLAFTNVGNVVFGCPQFMTVPSQTTGTDAQPWASYMTGKIDQVRVFNEVLPLTKATALYNLESAGR